MQTAPTPTPPKLEKLTLWLNFAALGAAWWAVFDCLRIEWSINEQYAYGWAVPWLALYLFCERWKCRPAPGHVRGRTHVAALLALLALGWLPAHLLQVASPDWRLIGWALVVLAISGSLGAVYLMGGWPWVRHFSFPICFMLIAVPWPVPLEQLIVQTLMRTVAELSVEALRWSGVPAVRQGNLIALGGGEIVGVEEACSGVRSFQTIIMVALFIGELWPSRWPRRVLLVAAGAVVAFAVNVGRAITLSALTAAKGAAVVATYHDAIGYTFLAVTLLVFGTFAFSLRDRLPAVAEAPMPADLRRARPIPWQYGAGLLAWLGAVWLGTELWYRSGEQPGQAATRLIVEWPESAAGFREIALPSRTGIILRNDEGRSATWRAPDGDGWSMVALRWNPGAAAVQLARAHTPEICLPAAGAQLQSDRGLVPVPLKNRTLPAHAYRFTASGRTAHVFYLRYGDDAGSRGVPLEMEKLTMRNRIRAAVAPRRNRGQQVVEVSITSSKNEDEATASFLAFAQRAFRVVEVSP